MSRKPAREKGNGPEKSGPMDAVPDAEKTQRITRLTKREALASVNVFILDQRIPEDDVRELLRNQPCQIDADRVVRRLRELISPRRTQAQRVHMEPGEIAKQARMTAAAVDEAMKRMGFMHPRIQAEIFKKSGLAIHEVVRALAPQLRAVRNACREAAVAIKGSAGRPARADRSELAKLLRSVSSPQLPAKDASALAGDLMTMCEWPE